MASGYQNCCQPRLPRIRWVDTAASSSVNSCCTSAAEWGSSFKGEERFCSQGVGFRFDPVGGHVVG